MSKKQLPFFLHVPKTAGSSVRTLIAVNYSYESVLSLYGGMSEIKDSCQKKLNEIDRIRIVQGHMPYGVHDFLNSHNPAYYFFLREPVSRTLSDIAFSRRYNFHGFHNLLSSPDLSIYNQLDIAKNITYYRNNMTHFLSGSFYRYDVSRIEYELALNNLLNSCFVGITEYFEESILIMGKKLRWINFIPQKCNISPAHGEIININNDIMKICASFLEYDIRLYDTALELFFTRKKVFGSILQEAAEQLRYIISEQIKDYPGIEYKLFNVGDGLDIPIVKYNQNILKSSPLYKWIYEIKISN